MQINFNVKGKIITLEWSDGETFKKVIGRQTSFFGKTPNEMTDEFVNQKLREEYTGHIEYILDNVPLPDNPTILDIGSGTIGTSQAVFYCRNYLLIITDAKHRRDRTLSST